MTDIIWKRYLAVFIFINFLPIHSISPQPHTVQNFNWKNPQSQIRLCVQPLGKYDAFQMKRAIQGITKLYGFEVMVLNGIKMPQAAYYTPRKRYRAEKILDFMVHSILPKTNCTIIIGFTQFDISTTKGKFKDWGIFGLGSVGGASAVISTFRLGRKTRNKDKIAVRTIKVVNHELGHVLGLYHCPNDRCLMNDAKGTIKTVDNETGLLCGSCKKSIENRYQLTLPDLQEFDWEGLLKTNPE